MSFETILAWVATSYGVVMALSPVLQIRRILRLRSSEDVSIGYLAVITFGFVIWTTYGTVIQRPALVIANSVAFVVGVITILVARRFRER
jgi:MtN3 and saliva related transmembrane protein